KPGPGRNRRRTGAAEPIAARFHRPPQPAHGRAALKFLLIAGLLLIAVPNHPSRARADALVTLCGSDDQVGPGTNFSAAIASGGTIGFNCPGHPALQITHVHVINRPTTIDGGDAVSLHLAAAGYTQMLFDAGESLGLRNIALTGNGSGTAV